MKTTYAVIATLVIFNIMLLYKSDWTLNAENRDLEPKDYLELIDGQEPGEKGLAILYVFYHDD